MLKKITTLSCNSSECVELILRGAKKRRRMAYDTASKINSDAGFKANISVVR